MSKSARGSTPAPRPTVKSPVTPKAIARVQGAVAKGNGGGVPKGSYVGRLQKAGAKAPTLPVNRTASEYTMSNKSDNDNHANQCNPNNDEYWHSRGEDGRPNDWDTRVAQDDNEDDDD